MRYFFRETPGHLLKLQLNIQNVMFYNDRNQTAGIIGVNLSLALKFLQNPSLWSCLVVISYKSN
jgi:hypothetical protein